MLPALQNAFWYPKSLTLSQILSQVPNAFQRTKFLVETLCPKFLDFWHMPKLLELWTPLRVSVSVRLTISLRRDNIEHNTEVETTWRLYEPKFLVPKNYGARKH
jgi:hypothetical protein